MANGVSILEGMVAKTEALAEGKPKRGITPLAAERGADTPLPTTPATFPNDVPTEVVAQKVKELTRIIEHLIESRDALQLLIGLSDQIKPADITAQKEAAADAKQASKREQVAEAMEVGFPERFSALQEAAQSATFGWKCSVHPDATAVAARSPKGREYMKCSVDGCKQFER